MNIELTDMNKCEVKGVQSRSENLIWYTVFRTHRNKGLKQRNHNMHLGQKP